MNFNDFFKKYNLKDNTMIEIELQRVYIYPIYPRDSKIYRDRVFVDIDNGSQGGSQWHVLFYKVTNHFTLIVSVELQIIFYSINYLIQ